MARGQKATPRAEWSENRKKNQTAWQRENRMKCAADVPRAAGETFRALCASQGLTVSAALASYIQACISSGCLLDVSAVGISGIVPAAAVAASQLASAAAPAVDPSQASPAGDACAVPDPCALPADDSPETVQAPETIPAAGENSQAGKGAREIPSNSQKSQPSPREIQEITRPAQCSGAFSPSDCTNTNPRPDMGVSASPAPRAPARVGNSAASAFPPEDTSPQEAPPEESPQE